MNREVKPTRSRRNLFRRIVFAVIGAVIVVSAPPLLFFYLYMYPLSFFSRLLSVFLGPSSEFGHYVDKCMEIRRGQTKQEVLAIMTEFRIASQKIGLFGLQHGDVLGGLLLGSLFARSCTPRDVS